MEIPSMTPESEQGVGLVSERRAEPMSDGERWRMIEVLIGPCTREAADDATMLVQEVLDRKRQQLGAATALRYTVCRDSPMTALGRQAAIEAAAKDWYERVRQAKGWAQVGNGWRNEWLARTEPIIDAYERALAEQSQEESRADEALCRFCGGEGWIGGELEPRRPCTGCNAEAIATAIADLTAERDDIDRRLLELRTQGPRISLVPRARTEAERTCQFCGKLIPIPEQTYGIDPRNLCHCCKVPRNEENR